jgi:hypothetical protein
MDPHGAGADGYTTGNEVVDLTLKTSALVLAKNAAVGRATESVEEMPGYRCTAPAPPPAWIPES